MVMVVGAIGLMGSVLRRLGGHLPLHHGLLLLQLLLGLVRVPLMRGTGRRDERRPKHPVAGREEGG